MKEETAILENLMSLFFLSLRERKSTFKISLFLNTYNKQSPGYIIPYQVREKFLVLTGANLLED